MGKYLRAAVTFFVTASFLGSDKILPIMTIGITTVEAVCMVNGSPFPSNGVECGLVECARAVISGCDTVICSGSGSCMHANITNTENVICSGVASCGNASIKNAEEVSCTGLTSCWQGADVLCAGSLSCTGRNSCQGLSFFPCTGFDIGEAIASS